MPWKFMKAKSRLKGHAWLPQKFASNVEVFGKIWTQKEFKLLHMIKGVSERGSYHFKLAVKITDSRNLILILIYV